MARGFLLQPTYRIESGKPVVLLYGRLESGESFLIRDDRQRPHFFVRRRDSQRAEELGAAVRPDERLALSRDPLARVEIPKPQDAPPLRERLEAAGISTFEADVRFAYRYLIDRGIRGTLEIEGASRPGNGIDRVFENPDVSPAHWVPRLEVLSFDIETDPKGRRLLALSLVGCGSSEVFLLTPAGWSCPSGATACRSERELLREFVRRVRELDPDVLTGWNVVDFDVTTLVEVASRTGVPLALGRGPEPVRLRPSRSPWGRSEAQVPGRVFLDGIELVRGTFLRFESYSLNSVASEVLGETKTITGSDRARQILEAFHSDREKLVEYNRRDAQLVLDILDRLHLVELAVERSCLTGMPPDRVAASIASFDFLYLSELARRGLAAPTVRISSEPGAPTSGGHVLEPVSGLEHNVLVLDFKSLYPSIIRTFQIDPLGHLPSPGPDDDPIFAPNGAAFSRTPGILPGLLDELFARRETAKAEHDEPASQAIKILMNSFYGVLGTPACRFAAPELANAITGFGREILLWCRSRIEDRRYRVLYGDTDSLFVHSGLPDPGDAQDLGGRLARELSQELSEHIAANWRVESRLELEFEALYLRLFLPAARHGSGGARKRYVGLVQTDGDPEVVFTGMEVVRRDWTELAKRIQRELYARLFTDRPVDAFLRDVVSDLRSGRLDDRLVYRKSLRKSLDAYKKSTPPHVAAARKMKGKPGRVIEYVITREGPEPIAERRAPLDREHYVQKQVRPVAEPVLTLLGLDFDEIIGDDTQLKLFD